MPDRSVGSVMIVGGGVCGVQSALDLANSGYKVYLVENKPAIGGAMSQLDKTFPTNDCSMCILSPQLVEAGRHRNIELLTLSELESVSGGAGCFTVRVRKRARSVDAQLCTGCGNCIEACPVQQHQL
ncbi:heterodisulfide reductase subunit A [Desulfosalsimonas propionicica]|uniref:Heterodisulfide reductase subunit A n=1 Tax=Desulfosalsimonas propionicica TaxID=332175 RepID=A0A7W0C6M2_9BACT|nr:heterodisulfide reductase subunit A [Desulfosalsimonas propionicica]